MLPDHRLTKVRSERELISGKTPLSPILRAGFLISGLVFVGVPCVAVALFISAANTENIFLDGLVLILALGWFLLFFTFGRRMIWSAFTAPSQTAEDDDDED